VKNTTVVSRNGFRSMTPIRCSVIIVPLAGLLHGCATPPRAQSDRSADASFSLLMPQRIRIVQPFTRVQGDNDRPDVIELLLQTVNALDNPGLMIVGRLRVELYEYMPASADSKGRQLEQWNVDLSTEDDQRAYWNALTQMYEFRLAVDRSRIPLEDKYVLAVTYDSPVGDRLSDQCLIAYRGHVRH